MVLHVLCDRNKNMQMSKQNKYKHGKSVKTACVNLIALCG